MGRTSKQLQLGLLLLATALSATAPRLGAQAPLAVLDHSPRDVARPTDVITITFDRPVTGSLEHTVDAAKVVRLDPKVNARFEWRDPSTIRIVPLEPLAPGARYDITVDTTFGAFDGTHLAAPARFMIAVRGPSLMGVSPAINPTYPAALDATGRILFAFSAPVPDSLLTRVVDRKSVV